MDDIAKILSTAKIREIRVADGGLDFDCNCWITGRFIIITDTQILSFTTQDVGVPEYDSCKWIVSELSSYSEQEYPYKLKTYTDSPFSFHSYTFDEELCDENLYLNYEDIMLWLIPTHPECSLLSVHGRFEDDESSNHSSCIRWDEYDDYYCIDFENTVTGETI